MLLFQDLLMAPSMFLKATASIVMPETCVFQPLNIFTPARRSCTCPQPSNKSAGSIKLKKLSLPRTDLQPRDMNGLSTFYDVAQVQPVQPQHLKSAFSGNRGHHLELDYHGHLQSFRLHFEGIRRLFFFEQDLFQKTLIKNEYGLVQGKVNGSQISRGWVKVADSRYQFKLAGEDPRLFLFNARSASPLLTCEVTDELMIHNLEATHQSHLLNCLVFALGWTLQSQLVH